MAFSMFLYNFQAKEFLNLFFFLLLSQFLCPVFKPTDSKKPFIDTIYQRSKKLKKEWNQENGEPIGHNFCTELTKINSNGNIGIAL